MHGIEQNPKLGYYKVRDQIFYSKPEAFIYASAVNKWPQWKFNLPTYGELDWTKEPETNIRELYRMRAQQLRDKYDYIRLECSGGSDSTTVAFSFLLNNIHVDEVIFRYPKIGEKNVSGNAYDTKATNTLSEFEFAAKPLLNWIKTNYPNTMVRIHDFAENMLEEDATRDESWIFQTRDWFQPAHADKYNQFNLKEHRELADSGKRIAVVTGIEKPRMCVIDNKWYVYFADLHANSAHPVVGDYTNITNEYFYWTPDFPEITQKQVHLIKQWFDIAENNHLRNLLIWPNTSIAQRTAYEQIVKSIIYPDYDIETWQTSKPTNSFYNEMDHWFYTNFKETNLYNAWKAGLHVLIDKIDPKYMVYELGQPVGLAQMFSPHYYVGNSTFVEREPAFQNNSWRNLISGQTMIVKDKKITQHKF